MTNKRLYLDNWSYNAALTLQELENIVLENGGAIVSTWKTTERDTVTISNRSIAKVIHEKQERLERFKEKGIRTDILENEIKELEAIPNEPVTLYYGDWHYICFTIGSDYYHFSLDRNPFFDFHYCKCPIIDGLVSPNYYMDKDNKEWLYDCFFSWNCTEEDRRNAANAIYNKLIKAHYSGTYRDKNKRKPNTLNILAGKKSW